MKELGIIVVLYDADRDEYCLRINTPEDIILDGTEALGSTLSEALARLTEFLSEI
jgi:hypothetical protein